MDLEAALTYMKVNGIGGKVTNALVVSHALERGVAVSADRKRRVQLRKGGHTWFFSNGWSNINHQLAVRCAKQKEVTSRLLRARGLHAPENAYFDAHDAKRAWAWAEPILPVVVKPHALSQGSHVHLNIMDRASFDAAFTAVVSASGSALVEACHHGVEHRIITVDGKIVAVTRRVPAHVIGDGRSPVRDLVAEKNAERAARRNPTHKPLRLDATSRAQLDAQGLTPGSIPDAGQHVLLRATSNISTGGDAIDATDELRPDEVAAMTEATLAFPGLRLAGFDVLLPREPDHHQLSIIEVNAAPMISMHHFPWSGQPRDVATPLLDAMFPDQLREVSSPRSRSPFRRRRGVHPR